VKLDTHIFKVGSSDMVVTLDLRSTVELTDERFEQICQSNRELKFERTAIGELVVVALTGGETGRRNIKLSARLEIWNEQSETGVAFDSSTGFRLPNGAIRSPDAAWIRLDRWQSLTPEQRRKLVPLCPDFVVELRSPSDEIAEIQTKMREYQENGLRLGWLLDPETQRVEIYRGDRTVEIFENPTQLSGEGVLSGFVLNLMGILLD
jgi:Uma2 family endonuclease